MISSKCVILNMAYLCSKLCYRSRLNITKKAYIYTNV